MLKGWNYKVKSLRGKQWTWQADLDEQMTRIHFIHRYTSWPYYRMLHINYKDQSDLGWITS